MNGKVVAAVFKRNFFSYFRNPTGYVFICVYVLLSSFAAFWPAEFFNANLANLDQLNQYLPFIFLIFIPAITMSVWAEERRQGTDELLLTMPAADIDVVVGKYLAAVAIFTVALLFSFVSNTAVLVRLGQPDAGLLFGTHIGYWLMGLAMLAIGMVASFLTSNLTVSYILGVVLNAPLAFAYSADVIVANPELAVVVKRWSLTEQFRDFGRGVISLSSVAYFLLLVAVMLYIAMVLIGRRHWLGGRDGHSMLGHYAVRAVALLVAVAGVNVLLANHDIVRMDVTTEKLSSLSPKTRDLVRNLETEYPVQIDAYVSPVVPEAYVQTRLNLLSTLREFGALGGDKVQVQIHEVETFSEEATRAEEQFNIRPQTVETRSRGAMTQEEIYLGAAFTCGLDKVVVPFFSKGLSVEYEIVRSISTVSDQQRKKVGVLTTDVPLYGGFDFQSGASRMDQEIINELRKQYEVEQVDPSQPITEKYDVLLAVQPSSLAPEQMDHFINVVLSGQPTAIFEDPFPYFYPQVAGTTQLKQPPGGANPFMGGRQPPPPKGEISRLWSKLGIDFMGSQVIWQNYNPYPKASTFITREWVFVGAGSGAKEPFNSESSISSGLQQALFLFPGSVRPLNSCPLDFTELATTGEDTGTVSASEVMIQNPFGPSTFNPNLPLLERRTDQKYVIAARLHGTLPQGNENFLLDASNEQENEESESGSETELNLTLVADIDMLHSAFFAVRARGNEAEDEINWQFDNVTLVLNILDELADDDRFIDIRKRRPVHRTLAKVEEATLESREEADALRTKFNQEFEQEARKAEDEFNKLIQDLQNRKQVDPRQMAIEVATAQEAGSRRLQVKRASLQQDRDAEIKRVERDLALEVRQVQDEYKRLAVLIPPIFPLMMAFFVYFRRRAREQEGVAKERLR